MSKVDGCGLTLDEATKRFKDALDNRRKGWVYDWMIPLMESERVEVEHARSKVDFRSHVSVHKPAWTLLCRTVDLARELKQDQQQVKTFVEESVYIMLDHLYKDLTMFEQKLLDVYSPSRPRPANADLVRVGCNEKVESTVSEMTEDIKNIQYFVRDTIVDSNIILHWIKQIYCQDSSIRLVGPVGERPLHVCFLHANHFKSDSPEDRSIRQGILNGAKKFLEIWDASEASVPYGKDYCAAVGSKSVKLDQKSYSEWEAQLSQSECEGSIHGEKLYPPFLKYLRKWVTDTYVGAPGSAPLYTSQSSPSTPASSLALQTPSSQELKVSSATQRAGVALDETLYDSERLVSTGLYEGETILYFSISSKDLDTVEWILQSHCSAYQPVNGLFFRPKERHCTEGDGIREWKRFFMRAAHYRNDYSATPTSYLGLDPISFAASQGRDQESNEMMSLLVKHCQNAYAVKTTAAVINQSDEYGNTPLHLAAWNGSKKIFAWLMQNGADLRAVNNDGLSPLSLTARFGLWDMFGFIRKEFLTHRMWQYGYVACSDFDFSHIDTTRNLGDYNDNNAEHQWLCRILSRIAKENEQTFKSLKSEICQDTDAVQPGEVAPMDGDMSCITREALIRQACLTIQQMGNEAGTPEFKSSFRRSRFVSALEVIRLYKPEGWYDAVKDCIDDLVLKKWSKCYFLVYIGQTCVPTFVIFVIFGIMWQHRKLTVMENSGIPGWFAAPPPLDDFEAQCGWGSIKNSLSGRLQAVLVVYGVLALIGVAVGQHRIGLHDLDPKRENKIAPSNFTDFFYLNLKSLLCTLTSGLFIAMGAARVIAGPECKAFYLNAEKNAMCIAALFLFANVLNMLRPIRAFGSFFTTIFYMIVTDLFRFTIVYMSFFLSFLIAIQTLYKANNHFIEAVVNNELRNASSFDTHRKASVKGGMLLTGGSPLLEDPEACSSKVMTTSDTAFKLLTVSLGDGFSDILQDSRTLPDPTCGGFRTDYILIVLYFTWIVLTNILAMNLLIAMLSRTFDNKFETGQENWVLDIVARVIGYERRFPELLSRAHRSSIGGLNSKRVLEDIGLTIMCVPEVHWLVWLCKGIYQRVFLACGTNVSCSSKKLGAFLDKLGKPGKGQISENMPALLDDILRSEKSPHNESITQKFHNLPERDAEFLILGLAYNIARKKDALRLSTKIMVKSNSKEESKKSKKAAGNIEIADKGAGDMKVKDGTGMTCTASVQTSATENGLA